MVDRIADRLGERAGVADAGGAAVTHDAEAEALEVVEEPGRLQVLGDHLGAGGQRALHPRLAIEAQLACLLGDQPGGHHHVRVGGVGARGDGGDDHVAVGQGEPLTVELHLGLVLRLDGVGRLGGAALALPRDDGGSLGRSVLAEQVGEVAPPLLLHRGQ